MPLAATVFSRTEIANVLPAELAEITASKAVVLLAERMESAMYGFTNQRMAVEPQNPLLCVWAKVYSYILTNGSLLVTSISSSGGKA